MNSFSFSSLPRLHFGSGKLSQLPGIVASFGKTLLLVSGKNTFSREPRLLNLFDQTASPFTMYRAVIETEPSPSMIDAIVNENADRGIQVVIAVGGGSVLDAGKAISAMLPLQESVKAYLEGVGTRSHSGKKIPFVAVPTTSGTGSEATKNAVLSEVGERGFKRSLRHENFIPDVALIDPELMTACPPQQTAVSGMDAFTQLLESYVSTQSNPITDALAVEGLRLVRRSLLRCFSDGSNVEARAEMSLAAYLSGITLANAGLGLVHGFASSIGGMFPIPHGVICSSLMFPANKVTVGLLPENTHAYHKYATVAKLFSDDANQTDEYLLDDFMNTIASMTEAMSIPKLSAYGISSNDVARIVSATENKNNPVKLHRDSISEVLQMAL